MRGLPHAAAKRPWKADESYTAFWNQYLHSES